MNCHDFQQLLQRRLDGEPIAESAELAVHLAACGECRALQAAALRFEAGIRLVRPAMPAGDLADRIVTQVLSHKRSARRRYAVRTVAALAAAFLLAVLVGVWASRRDEEGPALPQAHNELADPEQHPEPLGPSLRESMTEVAQLTIRSADETVRNLLPSPPSNNDAPSPLSTSVASLREAGNSVTTGLEPVADSAKRALNLFLREIPPVRAEDKRGS